MGMGFSGGSNRTATPGRRAASAALRRILLGTTALLGSIAVHLGSPEGVHGQAMHAEMFRGSADHRGELDTQGVEDFGRIAWRFETHGPVRSTPVMRDGVVFFGSTDGHLYATIRYGRRRMPSYQRIPETDRWDIVNYLRYMNGQKGVAAK